MMTKTFFNLYDVILIIGGLIALLLASMLFYSQPKGRIKREYWLCIASFFLLGALYIAETLFYWNVHLKFALIKTSPNLFFLFGFTLLLQGPLLYWFTRGVLYRDHTITKYSLVHIIPAACYPFFIYFTFHSLPKEAKLLYAIEWQEVVANPYFNTLQWVQRLSVLAYSLWCSKIIIQYLQRLKTHKQAIGKVDLQWLKLLVFGFTGINSLIVLTVIESRFTQWQLGSTLGALEIIAQFLYMGTLVVYLLKNSYGFADVQQEHTLSEQKENEDPQQRLADKIQVYLTQNKPYLEPNITVERLAAQLDVSPKLLSGTINKTLNMNFFELIGNYRIEEAKRKLTDDKFTNTPIIEVMKACGFNSKSVFYKAFKTSVGVTPSYYRQQYLD